MESNPLNNPSLKVMSKSFDLSMPRDFVILNSDSISEKYHFNEPYLNDGFILALCTSGEVSMKINLKKWIVNTNTLLFIYPNSVLEIIDFRDKTQVKAFFFSFDLITELHIAKDYDIISKMTRHPCVNIGEKPMNDLIQFYDFIVKQYDEVDLIYRRKMIVSLICAMNLKIRTIYKTTPINETHMNPSRQELLVDSFIRLLLSNYRKERNISFYADKLNLTPKYLSYMIKKVTGNSMLFWINQIVVASAKYRLKSTCMPIKQISDELDFPNPSLFGRFFKQHTGITPMQYRKSS